MRLSDKGLLRWYARCCNTPIANTPANYKASFAGIAKILVALLAARVSGRNRKTPLFAVGNGKRIAMPKVLSARHAEAIWVSSLNAIRSSWSFAGLASTRDTPGGMSPSPRNRCPQPVNIMIGVDSDML
jgi:hypothetical protein